MPDQPDDIAQQIEYIQNGQQSLPPLEKWHPQLSGDIEIRIARDGQWFFKGEPMAREALVRLFSTILRREEDGDYYLVTPVEKWRITVEDAPLLAHSLNASGTGRKQVLELTTNVGETLKVGKAHPLVMDSYPQSGEPRPLVRVRHGLDARLVTAAYYDLASRVSENPGPGEGGLGVWSDGIFFRIG